VWGSLAALFVGVLNSIRISFIPSTLWQLAIYVVMIASGGGLMFRSLAAYQESAAQRAPTEETSNSDDARELRRELEELKRRIDGMR
jgi:hypothetical protein